MDNTSSLVMEIISTYADLTYWGMYVSPGLTEIADPDGIT